MKGWNFVTGEGRGTRCDQNQTTQHRKLESCIPKHISWKQFYTSMQQHAKQQP